MSDVKVVNLTTSNDDDDEEFAAFIDDVKNGNESAVFLLNRKDGTMAVGSTYKDVKDLVWDAERLRMFIQDLIRGAV